jgi:uncharacterized membrane protein (UPF0127 family)
MKFKIALTLVSFCMTTHSLSEGSSTLPTTTVVISDQVKVQAELAYTDESRMRGLMFRESLAPDAGMLFVFPVAEPQGFWMKNTKIALDLIWLNETKEIVYFVTADPCKKDPCESYQPMQKAKYVLEVNAGFVKKHGLKLGSLLEFTLPPEVENVKN